MKRKLPYVFTILIISFVFSCSELRDQIPQAPDLSIHGEGVMNPSSSNFHGNYLAGNQKGFVSCYQCHSTDLSGGSAEVSCVNCHNSVRVHKEGINNPNSQDFHGKFIANNSWNLNDCKICHGSNYSGGKVSPSCLSCHAYKNGPEQCNTCHGSFSDTTRIAPPTALDGSSSTTSAGVGAHTSHLYDNNLGSSI